MGTLPVVDPFHRLVIDVESGSESDEAGQVAAVVVADRGELPESPLIAFFRSIAV